jgi:hypothetical protein
VPVPKPIAPNDVTGSHMLLKLEFEYQILGDAAAAPVLFNVTMFAANSLRLGQPV